MSTTRRRFEPTQVPPVRLRVDIFKRLMAGAGYSTIVSCADALNIDRSSVYNLMNGRGASLDLAMHIAAFLHTSVEVLFERVIDEAA